MSDSDGEIPPRDVVAEAKEDIAAVQDILGAKSKPPRSDPGPSRRPTARDLPPKAKIAASDKADRELAIDLVNSKGCATKVAVTTTAVIVIAILIWFLGEGDDDEACASVGGSEVAAEVTECGSSTTATPTTEQESDSRNGPVPPKEADLPKGVLLFKGKSGGPIGCIACDGQSRFLSLERDGVGVGDVNRAAFETLWTVDGEVLEFGARLAAANKGRYGVNVFIDGKTYGPGVALEIGEQSAVYKWGSVRAGPLSANNRVAIIVGEAGTVDDKKVPTARGDYQLEWWFTFRPK